MITVTRISQEYNEMMLSLEEGIVVIQDGKICFKNDLFHDIVEKIEMPAELKVDNNIIQI